METTVFGREDRIKELEKFTSPKYVGVAFNLPPACGTIWGLMEEEIDRFADEDPHPFSKSVKEVLLFLSIFFSAGLVEHIGANMGTLEKSLGIDYTLRPGKGMIARAVLDDARGEFDAAGSPLEGFLGHVDVPCADDDAYDDCPRDADADAGGWQRQGRRHSRSLEGSGNNVRRGGGRGSERMSRGLGRRAGGERGGGGASGVDILHFENLDRDTVWVPMSRFSTPAYGEPNKAQTLKSRSWAFVSHDLVGDHREEMYDPHISGNGKVYLFHGTRHASLAHFRRRGIDPRYRRNEFSMDAAFYSSNSIRQAYEHPLHYHPSSLTKGTVCVLVFEVDVRVLHGFEPPPGKSFLLTNLWFRDTEEDRLPWQNFCEENFKERGAGHKYDVVIGPVCLPNDGDRDYGKLSVSLSGNAPLTQVAFCSRRARAWLEQCFKKVFIERRDA